jgi:hypothetical protein
VGHLVGTCNRSKSIASSRPFEWCVARFDPLSESTRGTVASSITALRFWPCTHTCLFVPYGAYSDCIFDTPAMFFMLRHYFWHQRAPCSIKEHGLYRPKVLAPTVPSSAPVTLVDVTFLRAPPCSSCLGDIFCTLKHLNPLRIMGARAQKV